MRKLLAIAAATAALATAPAAFAADTETASASVEILPTITLTKVGDLAFGTIAVNGAGTATIAATATATPQCSANLVCAGTGGGAASFNAAGTDGVSFSASVDETSIDLASSNPANTTTIPLGSFTVGYDATKGTTLSGDTPVYVGGQLTFAGTEPADTYSADFNVTAEYE